MGKYFCSLFYNLSRISQPFQAKHVKQVGEADLNGLIHMTKGKHNFPFSHVWVRNMFIYISLIGNQLSLYRCLGAHFYHIKLECL